jgi:hypothetical protein
VWNTPGVDSLGEGWGRIEARPTSNMSRATYFLNLVFQKETKPTAKYVTEEALAREPHA